MKKKGFKKLVIIIIILILLLFLLILVPNIVKIYKQGAIDEMIIQENKLIESAEKFKEDYCNNIVSDEKLKKCETYYEKLPTTTKENEKEIITKYICIDNLKELGYYNEELQYLKKGCQGVVIFEEDKETGLEIKSYSYVKCGEKYTSNIDKEIDETLFKECFKDTSNESKQEESNKEYTLKLEQLNATTNGTESIKAKYNKPLPTITIPQRKYTVTFDYNDNKTNSTTSTMTYIFDGYMYNGIKYYESDGTSNQVWSNKFDATLSINWSITDINKVTLPTPTREGYTFDGWYTSEEGETKVLKGEEKYEPTSDITLYAKWNANKYKITFDTNGTAELKSKTKTVTYDIRMVIFQLQ